MRLLFLSLLWLDFAHSYNILVYIPKFAISHINFMGKLADTLVDAGHNVTALISEMDSNLPDGTRKASILRVPPTEGANHMNTNFMVNGVDMFEADVNSYSAVIENAYHNSVSFRIQCEELLKTPGLVERLRMEQYDALITESFELCGVGLSHLISPRVLIPVSSTFLYDTSPFGVYYSLITEHSSISDGRFHSTLWSRLIMIYHTIVYRAFYNTQNAPTQKVFDELYPGTPSFSSILSDAAVVFSNTEPLIDFARPTLTKIVPIGGISVPAPKSLDESWSSLLSQRPRTVLVSFGSIAKTVFMKPERKVALLEAFASFPDTTFIWKYESKSDNFATVNVSRHANVVLTEWMPQTDILADQRLSLFISHAGMASCHELAHFGVPALLIPIFGDQIHNAGAVAHAGIARVFSKLDMVDTVKLRIAIAEVLTEKSYKMAALRIRDQLTARPTSPVERFVKNVEFAARFGPSKSLRPLNLELSTIQLIGLDVIVAISCPMLVLIYSFFGALKFFLRFRSGNNQRKMQKLD